MHKVSKLSLLNVISQSKNLPRPSPIPREHRPEIPPALLPAYIRANSPLQLALQSGGFRHTRSPLDD